MESALDAVGHDAICDRIEAGDSQAEIAQDLGISVSALSRWLNKPERAQRSAQARVDSAESWLDKGLNAVKDAMDKGGNVDASAAKAYAQECARRASLRNPRYVEKTAHEHRGPGADGEHLFRSIERTIVKPVAD